VKISQNDADRINEQCRVLVAERGTGITANGDESNASHIWGMHAVMLFISWCLS